MIDIQLDVVQSAGAGALALVLGMLLTRKIGFLQRFCIPSPVSGGIIFSLFTLALYAWGGVAVSFDSTLKDIFMMAFFTSVGFQSNLSVLKQGGKTLAIMLMLLVVIITVQNLVPVGLAKLMHVDPLVGIAAGSVSMAGGHGTAGGFAGVLEGMGLESAGTIAMAAATFGLIAGSTVGGPLAERLIRKKLSADEVKASGERMDPAMVGIESNEATPTGRAKRLSSNEVEFQQYARATYWIVAVMALGTLLNKLFTLSGITFPTYFGALVLAAIVRNLVECLGRTGRFAGVAKSLDMDRVVSVGNISLSMFLGMAMISLKLWELRSLALPLLVMLMTQVVVLVLFCRFVAFRALGKDYDAAMLVAGICGFGLGATPNAMANMSAVSLKYHYSVKPFLIVPIVGAMFVDLINTGIISLFLHWLG